MDNDVKLPEVKIKASTEKPSMAKDIGNYVMNEYIKPKSADIMVNLFGGIANMVVDAFMGAIYKGIYKNDAPRNTSWSSRPGYTNYNAIYSRPQSQTGFRSGIGTVSTSNFDKIGQRSSREVQIIYVDTEEDAANLAQGIIGMIERYGKCRVMDLYEMLVPKVQTTYQDAKWGWINPNDISYHKEFSGEHRGQFMLDLPQPVDITNI